MLGNQIIDMYIMSINFKVPFIFSLVLTLIWVKDRYAVADKYRCRLYLENNIVISQANTKMTLGNMS